MSERRSRARLTSSEAREEFLKRAEELWDEFNAWYEAEPEATFDEIEEEIGQKRREFWGELVELSLRQGDLGAAPEGSSCKKCGKLMEFKGYATKEVHGLEADMEIPRAYYYCPSCKVGFFPPRPTSEAEEGSVE